jgi:hypothetical protein
MKKRGLTTQASWSGLLDEIAAAQVVTVIKTLGGARLVLLSEREYFRLTAVARLKLFKEHQQLASVGF